MTTVWTPVQVGPGKRIKGVLEYVFLIPKTDLSRPLETGETPRAQEGGVVTYVVVDKIEDLGDSIRVTGAPKKGNDALDGRRP